MLIVTLIVTCGATTIRGQNAVTRGGRGIVCMSIAIVMVAGISNHIMSGFLSL